MEQHSSASQPDSSATLLQTAQVAQTQELLHVYMCCLYEKFGKCQQASLTCACKLDTRCLAPMPLHIQFWRFKRALDMRQAASAALAWYIVRSACHRNACTSLFCQHVHVPLDFSSGCNQQVASWTYCHARSDTHVSFRTVLSASELCGDSTAVAQHHDKQGAGAALGIVISSRTE